MPPDRSRGAEQHWVDSTLASLSLRERVGQMVMVWMLGDYTNNGDSSYAEVHSLGRAGPHRRRVACRSAPRSKSRRSSTTCSAARACRSSSSADLEPGLGRLEGGVFSHYLLDAGGATVFPTAMAIAATGRDQDAYDVGTRDRARKARAVGIQINFAPVVDVNNNPSNPVINTRSFGEDPRARRATVGAVRARARRTAAQIATAKHFPGHGDTDVDSHVGLPIVGANDARDSIRVELVPFKAAIDAGAALVMTAHIALPAVAGDSTTPATLSPRDHHRSACATRSASAASRSPTR